MARHVVYHELYFTGLRQLILYRGFAAERMRVVDAAFLEDLWGRWDEADATVLQDDFSQRSNGIFQEWAKERLGSVDIEGRSG